MSALKIAFGCQARSGKDTCCDYLQKEYGGQILRFSGSLYDILHYAQETCGFEREKDTKFLQWIGTEWARQKDPDVWVKTTIGKVTQKSNTYVADLRFENEARALKKDGFVLVKVLRDSRPIDRDSKHQSEVDLLDYNGWDYVINNNGSLKDLYLEIEKIICEIQSK